MSVDNSKILVRKLSEEEFNEWDMFVENSQHGTVFHNTKWLTACDKVFPGDYEIWGCFRNGELVAGCPLRIYRSGIFKKSSGFLRRAITPYNGVVMKSMPVQIKTRRLEIISNRVIQSLSDAFENEKFSYIELYNSPTLVDVRPFVWAGWRSEVIYTYYLILDNPIREEEFVRNVRRSIRKATKLGMTLERSKNVNEYFGLYEQVLLRHHSRSLPYRKVLHKFLERIVPLIYKERMGEMWLLRKSSGETVAGEIVLFDSKRAYFWSAVNDPRFFDTGAASYLKLKLMEEYEGRFTEIDMIDADTPTIAHFKAGFNPKIVPHYAVKKSSTTYHALSTIYKLSYWNLYKPLINACLHAKKCFTSFQKRRAECNYIGAV